jgi:hypothetical protein
MPKKYSRKNRNNKKKGLVKKIYGGEFLPGEECVICLERPNSSFCVFHCPEHHKHRFCLECTISHVESKYEFYTNIDSPPKCPYCNSEIEQNKYYDLLQEYYRLWNGVPTVVINSPIPLENIASIRMIPAGTPNLFHAIQGIPQKDRIFIIRRLNRDQIESIIQHFGEQYIEWEDDDDNDEIIEDDDDDDDNNGGNNVRIVFGNPRNMTREILLKLLDFLYISGSVIFTCLLIESFINNRDGYRRERLEWTEYIQYLEQIGLYDIVFPLRLGQEHAQYRQQEAILQMFRGNRHGGNPRTEPKLDPKKDYIFVAVLPGNFSKNMVKQINNNFKKLQKNLKKSSFTPKRITRKSKNKNMYRKQFQIVS